MSGKMGRKRSKGRGGLAWKMMKDKPFAGLAILASLVKGTVHGP